MGTVVLGGKDSKVGTSTGTEREVKEHYAAGRYEKAYALTLSNRLGNAVSFLYVEEHRAKKVQRFLDLTGKTEWDGVLLCRNLAFVQMNPIPPRGIEDAKKLCKAPDQRETGQPGPAFYGFRTLIKDAANKGDAARQRRMLFKALLAGQLMATLTPEACEVARIYEEDSDLGQALAFWVMAWCMERERQNKSWFGRIGENIGRLLGKMRLDAKAAAWVAWSAKPLDSGEFPLYGTYRFPPAWTEALDAKLSDFDRSDPRRNYHYAQMLFQLGRVKDAIQVGTQSLRLARAASTTKNMKRNIAPYDKWQEAFPRGI